MTFWLHCIATFKQSDALAQQFRMHHICLGPFLRSLSMTACVIVSCASVSLDVPLRLE